MTRFNAKARHKARSSLVQALYQWQIAEEEPVVIEAQYREDLSKDTDLEYFSEIFKAVTEQVDTLDVQYTSYLDRSLQDLDYIELAILRLCVYELLFRLDIPYRVVINEGIELAKIFGAQDSHKFVNGVLDKLAQTARVTEINAERI